MRKSVFIVLCFVLAAALWRVYMSQLLPPGIEAKGTAQDWLPWVSLIGAIISLIAGLLTLILKIIELRQTRS